MKIEKIEKNTFVDVLRDYCIATKTLFWKEKALTLDKDTDTFYIPEKDCYYSVYHNKTLNNKRLVSYISKDRECHIPVDELNQLDCITMSADIFNKICDRLAGFNVNYEYGLIYDWSYMPTVDTERYSVVEFDFSDEQHYVEVSNIMHQGEVDDWMLPENIKKIARQYKENSIFEPDLWFFAKDNFENKIVGKTISSFNKELSETQIDWFGILPQFHGKGAGRFLLNETVNRSKGRSNIIHAGGTNEFYKKCGFPETNCRVWAAKESYEFVASCIQPNVLP